MLKKLQIPFLAFVVALSLGASITGFVYRQEVSVRDEYLHRQLEDLGYRASERLNQYVTLLAATGAFLGTRTGGPIGAERFATYVEYLRNLQVLGGVQGLGLALLAPTDDTAVLNARLAAEHGPDVGVKPEVTDQLYRSPVLYFEPKTSGNQQVIGDDMFARVESRAAMIRTKETGEAILTAPMIWLTEPSAPQDTGLILFFPAVEAGAGADKGFLFAAMNTRILVESLFDETESVGLLRVVDKGDSDTTLYESQGLASTDISRLIRSSQVIEVAGRSWEFVSYGGLNGASALLSVPVTLITALASLLISLAIALAIFGIRSSERHARELAIVMGQSLEAKDLHLREMSHRLKNVLARVVAISRQASRHATNKEEFVEALTQRLRAMATAQDQLTRAAGEGVNLHALIKAEIGQIYGIGDEIAEVDGPTVLLTTAQTQAMGLSIHELATNSLKYGAGSVPGARLSVRWEVLQGEKGREVHLTWDEQTGIATSEPPTQGFGTKLLESCISLELSGQFRRIYHSEGLTVKISFPLDR